MGHHNGDKLLIQGSGHHNNEQLQCLQAIQLGF